MSKTVLLAAASIIALCAGSASAAGLPGAAAGQPIVSFPGKFSPLQIPKGAKILYNQNSNYAGDHVNSENFTCGIYTGYDDQGADDFVVPKGATWTITEVDVSGAYSQGSGPAVSENVIFYKDSKGMPGSALKKGTFNNLEGEDSRGNFAITLPGKGVTLRPGHYWVSVIANLSFNMGGLWNWEVNSVQHRKQAMWQNPQRGFDICPTWGTLESCLGQGPDLMFDLRGTSQGK